jgi:hypothetical protein
VWITLKAKGDWAQVDLQGSGRCSVLKRLWYSLVELPEIPSVVSIQGSDRRLASTPNTIEVVKISIP